MTGMENVFVYGSLKRGFGNHRVVKNSVFIGPTITKEAYEMVSLGYFPGLTKNPVAPICGELYSVDKKTMRDLDRLEGNGSFYNREKVMLNNGTKAWVYFLMSAPNSNIKAPLVNGLFNWEMGR